MRVFQEPANAPEGEGSTLNPNRAYYERTFLPFPLADVLCLDPGDVTDSQEQVEGRNTEIQREGKGKIFIPAASTVGGQYESGEKH